MPDDPSSSAWVDAEAPRATEDERREEARRTWFFDHYEHAAGETIQFLHGSGISVEGATVGDVGCGDGIIDLGIVHRGKPDTLTGFDVIPTDVQHLLAAARHFGVADQLPKALHFTGSGATSLPADDASFDIVISWSAFEHIGDPRGVLTEIRRVLKPSGVFFMQLWPFYHSERGSHLWDWFPDGFHHLQQDDKEIATGMRASDRHQPDWTEYMLREYRTLNRITLDELQAEMVAVGLVVRRAEVMAPLVSIPEALARVPLSKLTTAGVKLIAVPAGGARRPQPAAPAPAESESEARAALAHARRLLESWPAPRSAGGRLKRRLLRAEEDKQQRLTLALVDALEVSTTRSATFERDVRAELVALRGELECLREEGSR